MGKGYELVNIDKKEKITFLNIDTGFKLRELSGTSVVGSIVTYYMIKNSGNRISFINDSDGNYSLFRKNYYMYEFQDYKDVTNLIVNELIENEIIKDKGIKWIDKEDNLFYRDLINIWDPKFEWNK